MLNVIHRWQMKIEVGDPNKSRKSLPQMKKKKKLEEEGKTSIKKSVLFLREMGW